MNCVNGVPRLFLDILHVNEGKVGKQPHLAQLGRPMQENNKRRRRWEEETSGGGDDTELHHLLGDTANFHEADVASHAISAVSDLESHPTTLSNTTVLQIPDVASEAFLTSIVYELESATGTRLAVQPAAAGAPSSGARRTVTITGDEDARQRCAQLILTRAFSRRLLGSACAPAATPTPAKPSGCASMSLYPSESQTLKMEIPNDATVNFVIGAKGASIMAMQDETGCNVTVAKASELPPGATVRSVAISGGTDQQRERCASMVCAKVAEYQQLEQVCSRVRPAPRLRKAHRVSRECGRDTARGWWMVEQVASSGWAASTVAHLSQPAPVTTRLAGSTRGA